MATSLRAIMAIIIIIITILRVCAIMLCRCYAVYFGADLKRRRFVIAAPRERGCATTNGRSDTAAHTARYATGAKPREKKKSKKKRKKKRKKQSLELCVRAAATFSLKTNMHTFGSVDYKYEWANARGNRVASRSFNFRSLLTDNAAGASYHVYTT